MKPIAWFRRILGLPYHTHDCKKCIYLGHYRDPSGGDKSELFDLYYCPPPENGSDPNFGMTLIARWSSNGPDYTSGMIFGYERWLKNRDDPNAMAEAYRRILPRGLPLGRYQRCFKHGFENGYRCPMCEGEYLKLIYAAEEA